MPLNNEERNRRIANAEAEVERRRRSLENDRERFDRIFSSINSLTPEESQITERSLMSSIRMQLWNNIRSNATGGIDDWSNNTTMEEKKINKKIKDSEGITRDSIDCVYYDGVYFHKSHKDVKICKIDGTPGLIFRMVPIFDKIDVENKKFLSEYGFVHNKYGAILIPVSSSKYGFVGKIVSENDIVNWKYKESISSGSLVDENEFEQKIVDIKYYEAYKNYFSTKVLTKQEEMKIGRISPSYSITEGLKYTFGVELEMSRGFLPMWKAAQKYNVLCIRDGSVDGGAGNGGPEIVTGVMTGDTGINHLQEICLELSKRTMVNYTCGYHLHLGNIDFTPKFLVNSYRLALFLEDEIFQTLPKSRRKNKYCRKLKPFNFRPALGNTTENIIEIKEDYNQLFKYISYEKLNNPTFEYNKSTQHPLGAKCSYNHDTPRYCWLNYVPAMFNTRNNGSYTLEIRHHSGTTNFIKVKNWLLLFMAFVAFVEKYPELIVRGITIKDVLTKIYPKKSEILIQYFEKRKELFSIDSNEDLEYKNSEDQKKSIKELINK